jgi:hypothetical protein
MMMNEEEVKKGFRGVFFFKSPVMRNETIPPTFEFRQTVVVELLFTKKPLTFGLIEN